MYIKQKQMYEFGPFRLDPAEYLLLREGAPVALTPKVFETLLILVQRSGHLVDKNELMKELWPDTIVEENNLTRNISALRKALSDAHAEHLYIETVPKRGYRFAAKVKTLPNQGEELVMEQHTMTRILAVEGREIRTQSYSAPFEQGVLPARSKAQRVEKWKLRVALGLFLMLLIGLGAALSQIWFSKHRDKSATSVAGRPALRSIAVLPFKTMGIDSSNEYLGLGMTDALINRLSNIREIVVRPTSAMRRYTEATQDPVAAGRQQGVEAVLDGSVQRVDERVRVTVQLVRVQDGA